MKSTQLVLTIDTSCAEFFISMKLTNITGRATHSGQTLSYTKLILRLVSRQDRLACFASSVDICWSPEQSQSAQMSENDGASVSARRPMLRTKLPYSVALISPFRSVSTAENPHKIAWSRLTELTPRCRATMRGHVGRVMLVLVLFQVLTVADTAHSATANSSRRERFISGMWG